MRRITIHNYFPAPATPTNDWNAYPSYTLAELERWSAEGTMDPGRLAKVREEIEARKNGTSRQKVTPVTPWGGGSRVSPRVGRM